MPSETHVTFVDDDLQLLAGLRRMLAGRRGDWHMEFLESGAAALAHLEQEKCDVLITDIRMPEMSGAELLSIVAEKYPCTARVILSGAANEFDVLLSAQSAHQFLAKPCSRADLDSVIARALSLRALLGGAHLVALVNSVKALPSFPRTTTEIVAAVQSEDASADEIGRIVSRDAALSAKVLQLVNSSFFGLAREISNPREAVKLLGSTRVTALSVGTGLMAQVPRSARRYSFDRLWRRSIALASSAEWVAKQLGAGRDTATLSHMAGLLSVTGTLLLASQLTDRYLSVADSVSQIADQDAVVAEFGVGAGPIGAYLLGLWGLPAPVVEAVAYHRRPDARPGSDLFVPLIAAHVACGAVEGLEAGEDPVIDVAYLESVGVTNVDLLIGGCRIEPA